MMRLSLIGMSRSGKSHWSKKLAESGFTRFCCDELIAKKLATELRGPNATVNELGAWMGFPFDPGFEEREARYLSLEIEVLRELIQYLEEGAGANTVDLRRKHNLFPSPAREAAAGGCLKAGEGERSRSCDPNDLHPHPTSPVKEELKSTALGARAALAGELVTGDDAKSGARVEARAGSAEDSGLELSGRTERIVLDTTGSVIYTGDEILEKLRELTTVVHLQTPPDVRETMLKSYLEKPRPVLWQGHFNQRKGESRDQALVRCYANLLSSRERKYEENAHVTLDYATRRRDGFTVEDFLAASTPAKR